MTNDCKAAINDKPDLLYEPVQGALEKWYRDTFNRGNATDDELGVYLAQKLDKSNVTDPHFKNAPTIEWQQWQQIVEVHIFRPLRNDQKFGCCYKLADNKKVADTSFNKALSELPGIVVEEISKVLNKLAKPVSTDNGSV